MASRLNLHNELKEVLGSNNVYYQPPESFKIKYPCFVYKREQVDQKYADNYTYTHKHRYTVTYIDLDPDNNIVERMIDHHFMYLSVSRGFVSDGLYHQVFEIYY